MEGVVNTRKSTQSFGDLELARPNGDVVHAKVVEEKTVDRTISTCPETAVVAPAAHEMKHEVYRAQYSVGWGWFGTLLLWLIVLTMFFWLIFFTFPPAFVKEGDVVSNSRCLLAGFVVALIIVIIVAIIMAIVGHRRC